MTVNIDYPPTREIELGVALEDAEQQVVDADEGDERLARSMRDGLSWAVEQYGGDATITITAHTAATRAEVTDTLRSGVVGTPGPERQHLWLAAAGIDDAPWLDGGEDLSASVDALGQLPPGLVDYLGDELDDINDLSEGN